MLAAFQNFLAAELDAGAGYLIQYPRIEIPKPPPFIGGSLALNNINVSGSTIGAVDTGSPLFLLIFNLPKSIVPLMPILTTQGTPRTCLKLGSLLFF
jgi:hypothetical protein